MVRVVVPAKAKEVIAIKKKKKDMEEYFPIVLSRQNRGPIPGIGSAASGGVNRVTVVCKTVHDGSAAIFGLSVSCRARIAGGKITGGGTGGITGCSRTAEPVKASLVGRSYSKGPVDLGA